MNITAINGSPKGPESNTHVMLRALCKGYESPASNITNIFLSEKKIAYCRGCHSCWFTTPGKCAVDDDMAEIIGVMKESDCIMFGSPLYFNNISGTLKVFFDRLTAMGGDPHKQDNAGANKKASSFIMVSNCGFPYRTQFDVVSHWIHNVANMLQVALIGEFYTANGRVLSRPEKDQAASRDNYLAYLAACGRELFENGVLTDELKASLEKGVTDF